MENHLAGNGIDPVLHNLAPILEISLLAKAGFGSNAEQDNAREEEGRKFLLLQEWEIRPAYGSSSLTRQYDSL